MIDFWLAWCCMWERIAWRLAHERTRSWSSPYKDGKAMWNYPWEGWKYT